MTLSAPAAGNFRTLIIPAIFFGALLASCSDPPPKPVPPLDINKKVLDHEPIVKAPAAPAPATLTRMPVGDLYQLAQRNAALIYDVRPKMFYKMGHIPGAISWPKADYDRDLSNQIPPIQAANTGNTPVVLYCTDLECPDALHVASALVAQGHSVSVLQGGYKAWRSAAQ